MTTFCDIPWLTASINEEDTTILGGYCNRSSEDFLPSKKGWFLKNVDETELRLARLRIATKKVEGLFLQYKKTANTTNDIFWKLVNRSLDLFIHLNVEANSTVKEKTKKSRGNTTNSESGPSKGTGYGTGAYGNVKNPQLYQALENEKQSAASLCIRVLLKVFKNSKDNKNRQEKLFSVFEKAKLIPILLSNYLRNDSLMEIVQNIEFYQAILNLYLLVGQYRESSLKKAQEEYAQTMFVNKKDQEAAKFKDDEGSVDSEDSVSYYSSDEEDARMDILENNNNSPLIMEEEEGNDEPLISYGEEELVAAEFESILLEQLDTIPVMNIDNVNSSLHNSSDADLYTEESGDEREDYEDTWEQYDSIQDVYLNRIARKRQNKFARKGGERKSERVYKTKKQTQRAIDCLEEIKKIKEKRRDARLVHSKNVHINSAEYDSFDVPPDSPVIRLQKYNYGWGDLIGKAKRLNADTLALGKFKSLLNSHLDLIRGHFKLLNILDQIQVESIESMNSRNRFHPNMGLLPSPVGFANLTPHTYSGKHPSALVTRKIMLEMAIMAGENTLPRSRDMLVLARVDEENPALWRLLISGPVNTPYAYGLFLFDLLLNRDYPASPPSVKLLTTGHGTVRFNPNLYNCGKVCLSLLGTWGGSPEEQWNSNSTLLQLIISIQSLILVDEPYFNEPGYQHMQNTPQGQNYSKQYNANICVNTFKWAILDHLKREDDSVWGDSFRVFFGMNKENILKQLDNWQMAYNLDTAPLEELKSEFISLLKN